MSLPTPYYQDDCVTIYHGDALELLPRLPAFDVLYTSPPYNVGMKYSDYNDRLPDAEFEAWMERWLITAAACAAETCRAYICVGDKLLPKLTNPPPPWAFAQLIAWLKPNIASGGGRMTGDWNHMAEWVVELRIGKRTPMLHGEGNTFNWLMVTAPQSNYKEKKEHPAQQPVKLPRQILSRTPSTLIVDCFMGSGTTIRAAKDLGRKAIGIDISEQSCQMAAKRISQSVLALKA